MEDRKVFIPESNEVFRGRVRKVSEMNKAENAAIGFLLDYTARFHDSIPTEEYGGVAKILVFGKMAKEALDRGCPFTEEEIIKRLGEPDENSKNKGD